MKNFVLGVLLLFVFIPFLLFAPTYAYRDSIGVSATAVTIGYTPKLIGATLWFDGCEGLIKYTHHTEDGLNDIEFIHLEDGQPFYLWPDPTYEMIPAGLCSLRYRSVTGTGSLYITGTRNQHQ